MNDFCLMIQTQLQQTKVVLQFYGYEIMCMFKYKFNSLRNSRNEIFHSKINKRKIRLTP